METLNSNNNASKDSNNSKKILWIISYFSWISLVITGWISIKWLNEEPSPAHIGWTIWTMYIFRNNNENLDDKFAYGYLPFQMHVALVYIVFILALIIILGGCIVLFIKTLFKPDEEIKNGMMGNISKFHFFPLLCASGLFIIGECVDSYDKTNLNAIKAHIKGMYYSGLALSILALISFIIIYIKTEINTQDWWVILLLKKGTYSYLIILIWYYFCNNIFYIHYISILYADEPDPKDSLNLINWIKGCGLAFSIIFGIGSLVFSIIFKDLVASFVNALIYVGLTVYYFKIHKDLRKEYNNNGDGIVDIIMIVLSVAIFAVLLIKYKEKCLKS